MEFTFKGTRMNRVMFCVNGEEPEPYKSIEQIAFSMEEPPLSDMDRLTFIEENYMVLLAICAELHAGWLAEQPSTVH